MRLITYFQHEMDRLAFRFRYIDEESGIDRYQLQIFDQHQGNIQQLHPGTVKPHLKT